MKNDYKIYLVVMLLPILFSCSFQKDKQDNNDKKLQEIKNILKVEEFSNSFQILPYKDSGHQFSEGLLAVENDDGKWGFIDKTGKKVISPKYLGASEFKDNLAQVQTSITNIMHNKIMTAIDGTVTIIDKTGKEIVPIQKKYMDIAEFSDDLALFCTEGEKVCGYIDKNGKEVIVLQRVKPGCEGFKEGLACVFEEDEFEKRKYGYIDKSGNIVIPVQLQYDNANNFHEGLALLCNYPDVYIIRTKNCIFIDKTGKEILSLEEYSDAKDFHEGLAAVEKYGKWGFIDKTGKEVISLQYDAVGNFYDGVTRIKKNKKWGLIDKTGKEIIFPQYDDLGDYSYLFQHGFAIVKKNEQYGFIDKTGKEITPLKYDRVRDFSNDLAAVKKNEKWGFIDKTGKEVIPLQYDIIADFHENLAKVKKNNQVGFINKQGQWEFMYDIDVNKECNNIHPEQLFEKEGFQFKVISIAPQSGQVVVQELSTQEYFPTHCWEVPK